MKDVLDPIGIILWFIAAAFVVWLFGPHQGFDKLILTFERWLG